MAGRRRQSALRLEPVNRLQFFEGCQQPLHITGFAGMHNIDIEGVDGRALQHSTNTANHDELHLAPA